MAKRFSRRLKTRSKKFQTRKKIRGNQWIRGKKGASAQFISRSKAVRRLQMSLKEFRQLCILKGIYPRQPNRALEGRKKTYYLKKDMAYILHDPIVKTIESLRTWKRKLIKAQHKREELVEKTLMDSRPHLNLNHIVKERYPNFDDALQDIDDCLTMVFFFATLTSGGNIKITRIKNCKKLAVEFMYYITKSHSLRKVFVSIKGIYYQAEVRSHTITWIVPHNFTMPMQSKVDYNVMLTFSDFYEVLLGFVNFKLFHNLGLSYPPNYKLIKARKGEFLESIMTKEFIEDAQSLTGSAKKEKKVKADPEQIDSSKERISSLNEKLDTISPGRDFPEEDDKKEGDEDNEVDPQREADDEEVFHSDESILLRKEQETYEGLFSNCHFWLSREVPRESLEFVIKCFGGRVSWDGNGKETDKSITHYIADRPIIENQDTNRDYIQPQWVYDSVNNRILLPVHDYAPNTMLPPHLSPFVDDYNIGYVPDYRKKLDQYYFEKTGIRREREVVPIEEEEAPEENEEEEYTKELAKEKAGKYEEEEVAQDEKKKTPPKKRKKTDDELQAQSGLTLLSGNQRRLLKPFKKKIASRNRYIKKLTERKTLLEEGKANITDNTFVPVKQKPPRAKKESLYYLPRNHPAWRGTYRPRSRFPRSAITKHQHSTYRQSQRRTVQ